MALMNLLGDALNSPASQALMASQRTRSGVPLDVIAVIGLLLFGGCWALIPKWWRDRLPADKMASDHLNRAFLANIMMLNCLTFVICVVVAEQKGWISRDLARPAVLVLAALAVLSVLLIGTIYAFNWPKFLVPPRTRKQQGRFVRRSGSGSQGTATASPNREERRRRRP